MDPNLLRVLASGTYPTPLSSPQESINMIFPMQLNTPLLQHDLLHQMACQQFLYQQAYSHFLMPSQLPTKAISPISQVPLTLPTKLIEDLNKSDSPPKLSTVTSFSSAIIAALSSPTTTTTHATVQPSCIMSPQESPKTTEPHCSSPSTSNQSKDKEPEEEEDLFVDVESVDNKIANKDRRKAHVEFFRKVKSIRQRAVIDASGEKSLPCAICNEKVPMQDNAIQLHVNIHAEAGGFRCQLCGYEMKEKAKIYKHMKDRHPNKTILIEDRRNMNKLSAYIELVFPRSCSKTKKDTSKELDLLIKILEGKKMPEVGCAVCEKKIAATKPALTRHANSHSWYRCKSCKFTTDNEKQQEVHQITEHKVATPRLTNEYNLCTAVEVVARQITRCFGHAM